MKRWFANHAQPKGIGNIKRESFRFSLTEFLKIHAQPERLINIQLILSKSCFWRKAVKYSSHLFSIRYSHRSSLSSVKLLVHYVIQWNQFFKIQSCNHIVTLLFVDTTKWFYTLFIFSSYPVHINIWLLNTSNSLYRISLF